MEMVPDASACIGLPNAQTMAQVDVSCINRSLWRWNRTSYWLFTVGVASEFMGGTVCMLSGVGGAPSAPSSTMSVATTILSKLMAYHLPHGDLSDQSTTRALSLL